MPNRKRQGNYPTRRVAPPSSVASEVQSNLEKARYTGSAHHKPSRPTTDLTRRLIPVLANPSATT